MFALSLSKLPTKLVIKVIRRTLRHGIVLKDTLLAKDVSLTVLNVQADGAYMKTVEFNSPEDALSTLEGGFGTVEKQMDFLRSGLSEL